MLEMCGVADDSTRCVRMEDRAYLHTKRRRGLLSREELQREELQKRVCRLGLVEFNKTKLLYNSSSTPDYNHISASFLDINMQRPVKLLHIQTISAAFIRSGHYATWRAHRTYTRRVMYHEVEWQTHTN